MREFHPIGDHVVVKPIKKDQQTKGGIVIPDTATERPEEAQIIAAGPGRITERGVLVPMALQKGDLVLFNKFAGTQLTEDEEEYLMLREGDVLAKISKS
jgi:chaperonin GroES